MADPLHSMKRYILLFLLRRLGWKPPVVSVKVEIFGSQTLRPQVCLSLSGVNQRCSGSMTVEAWRLTTRNLAMANLRGQSMADILGVPFTPEEGNLLTVHK